MPNLETPSPEAQGRALPRSRRAGSILPRLTARLQSRLRASSTEEYNERVIYGEAVFQAIANAGVFSFITVFLVRLGAPNWLVGLYTSLPALITILAALPAGAFVQRQRNLIATANWGRFIFRAGIGGFALLPLLPLNLASYVLVGVRSLLAIPDSVLNIAITTMWGQATSAERRPRMLSTRMAIHGLFGSGLGFLFGKWLDSTPFPFNYQMVFVSGFLAGLGSIIMIARLRLPETKPPTMQVKKGVDLRQVAALIKRTPAFRNYAIALFIFEMSMVMPSALYSIYRVRTLGASDTWIGLLLTIERLVSVVTYFTLGRILTQPKFRRWLWLSCLGGMLYPLTTALAHTPQALIVTAFVGGTFGAGIDIFITNTLYQVSPEPDRPTFVAAHTILANLTAFAGPVIGTALADATTIGAALYIITGLRAVSSLSFWLLGVTKER